MDALPWHLQLKIYRGIGMDTLRIALERNLGKTTFIDTHINL